jgi:RNA polymerase sigma-70 factor (ECF subfamily)
VIADEQALRALMLRGLGGDDAAHRDFLKAISGHLRAFFRARLRASPEDAEDLVQETVIAIHTRRDSYDSSYPVTAWVYAIARYRLIDHLRKRKRRGEHVSIDDTDELFTESEDQASDAKRDVGRLLATLPQKQRDVIRLVKLEQMSVRDAAAQLGLSESDVKVSVHRGLKSLSALMSRESIA